MKNIVIGIFGFFIALIVSIWVLMYGWGLEPKSWGWIIGGGVFIKGVIVCIETIAKREN
jgi:hypothetical protein